jgi:hydroxypyruvate isomerase
MKLAVLVDIFFRDLPFAARPAEIAACGYRHIETWGGKDAALLQEMAGAAADCGVELVGVVLNFADEDDVAPVRAEARERFVERVDRCTDNALAAGCRAGIVTSGNRVAGLPEDRHFGNLVAALRAAGELAARKGFLLNLEPLNTEVDHPGYYLESRATALDAVKAVALPNVRLLYDIYHMAIMNGNQVEFVRRNIAMIGHFHLAGVPGRHEPFEGEINYPFVLRQALAAGYTGCFGLEYMPRLASGLSLRRSRAYLTSGAEESAAPAG